MPGSGPSTFSSPKISTTSQKELKSSSSSPPWYSQEYLYERYVKLYKYLLHILTNMSEIERILSYSSSDYLSFPLLCSSLFSFFTVNDDSGSRSSSDNTSNSDLGCSRITSKYSSHMSCLILQSILSSNQLYRLRQSLTYPSSSHAAASATASSAAGGSSSGEYHIINISSTYSDIISIKKISKKKILLQMNLKLSLRAIQFIQIITSQLITLQKTSFSWNNNIHYELLNTLWLSLMPQIQRSSSYQCKDWGEIGFQGNDPSTDFRGMGLLGLKQLTYFATQYPQQAQEILKSSNHIRRYYPFAATGINITAFILELCLEYRLMERILDSIELLQLNYENLPVYDDNTMTSAVTGISAPDDDDDEEDEINDTTSGSTVPLLSTTSTTTRDQHHPLSTPLPTQYSADHPLYTVALNAVHNIYCEVYIEFNRVWEERDPENIMAFQEIFNQVKAFFRQKYQLVRTV